MNEGRKEQHSIMVQYYELQYLELLNLNYKHALYYRPCDEVKELLNTVYCIKTPLIKKITTSPLLLLADRLAGCEQS